MKTYHVTWEINIDAESERDAAERALAIQRDAASEATVFDVIVEDGANTVRVDLMEEEE